MARKPRRVCENCGQKIAEGDTPYLHNWKVVCAACDLQLRMGPPPSDPVALPWGLTPQLLLKIVLVAGVAGCAGVGLYEWGYSAGERRGAVLPVQDAKPDVRPAVTDRALPDDPDAVRAMMRYGLIRKGMDLTQWKGSAEPGRTRSVKSVGRTSEGDECIAEESVAGSELSVFRYKVIVRNDKVVSWSDAGR